MKEQDYYYPKHVSELVQGIECEISNIQGDYFYPIIWDWKKKTHIDLLLSENHIRIPLLTTLEGIEGLDKIPHSKEYNPCTHIWKTDNRVYEMCLSEAGVLAINSYDRDFDFEGQLNFTNMTKQRLIDLLKTLD